jgi:hypothetical protein
MPWYFGTDTNHATPFPAAGAPEHFYLGRLGGETVPGGIGWDGAAAAAAHVTGSYWDLAGPASGPANLSDSLFGARQAAAFIAAHRQTRLSLATLFGDVEPGNGGWILSQTPTALRRNRAVLQGFLRYVYRQRDLVPGLYVSVTVWDTLFGRDYRPGVPFVWWLAGSICDPDPIRAPAAFPRVRRGAMRAMIWQYWIPTPVCGDGPDQDRDVTPFDGFLRGAWHPTA